MTLQITPSGEACGAAVSGVDLSKPLDEATHQAIHTAWLEHHVLAFPHQSLSDDALEAFTLQFGPFGDDPFIAPIPGRDHIIAVQRAANEKAPLFAQTWHSDWSFQKHPPIGTCLYGITIPPIGGDTLFANQHLALEQMPDDLRAKIDGKVAIHSAGAAYSNDGSYGDADAASDRSMDIRPSTEANATQSHPFIQPHPETGRDSLFSCAGYIVGIEGMEQAEAWELITELFRWQGRPEFVYRHKWEPNMLVMWDNRCLLHMATGGYDGHDRLLHRTTIGYS